MVAVYGKLVSPDCYVSAGFIVLVVMFSIGR